MYNYDRITFSSFHILQLCELASQAALNQSTGIFVTVWLLTGRLQVRILFGEPKAQEAIFRALQLRGARRTEGFLFMATCKSNTSHKATGKRSTS
jgi:hypothetical protein